MISQVLSLEIKNRYLTNHLFEFARHAFLGLQDASLLWGMHYLHAQYQHRAIRATKKLFFDNLAMAVLLCLTRILRTYGTVANLIFPPQYSIASE